MRTSLASSVLSLALFAACSSSGSNAGGDGTALRVTLRGYQAGQRFELVSESHTDRVEYYSQARADAARKVQTDEVMDALLEELERLGLEDHVQNGRAPRAGGELITWSIEVERDGRTEHWAIGRGSNSDERKSFHSCLDTFVQLYNLTASYQTIENPSGGEVFQGTGAGRT